MVDTVRTLAALQTLLADNTAGNISAQDLRDFLVSVYPAWQSHVPVLTATSSNPDLGTGPTQYGDYLESETGLVIYQFGIIFGTSPDAGSGTYKISLPVTARHLDHFIGVVWIRDAATADRAALARVDTADPDLLEMRVDELNVSVAHNQPWAWTAADQIKGSVMYERA